MPTPLETYQDKAKQKARVLITRQARDYLPETQYRLDATIDATTAQTITDLIDELQEEMGEEYGDSEVPPEFKEQERWANTGYNTLHRKLTKKFNQIRM